MRASIVGRRFPGLCASLFACTNVAPEPQVDVAEREPAVAPTVAPPRVEPARPVAPAVPPTTPRPAPDPPPAPDPIERSFAEPREFPDGPIPTWCHVTVELVTAEQLDRAATCEALGESIDDCGTAEIPWIDEPPPVTEVWPVALFVARGRDRFERLVLATHGIGSEEIERFELGEVRSGQPLDASVVMFGQTKLCDDGWEDDPTQCEFADAYERLVAVTDLADGEYLVATAFIDLEFGGRSGFPGARVALVGDQVDVWACDGRVRLALPEGAVIEQITPTPPAPSPIVSPPSAAEAKAAGKRCGAGWSLFGDGKFSDAKLEIDAALAVLEAAEDSAGKRSLGACLYNRGRIAEQEGELEAARQFYRRSLAARPNETVQARLDTL